MRWETNPIQKIPKEGDVRIVKKFLFLPLSFDNETRWLEWAYLEQEYVCREFLIYEWKNIRFINP